MTAESRISLADISTWAGVTSMAAGGLIVVSQIANLVVGLTLGPDSIATVVHTLKNVLALFAMYALLLALTGLCAFLYLRAIESGRYGVVFR